MSVEAPSQKPALDAAQKRNLLLLARQAIVAHLAGLPASFADEAGLENVYAGLFVSLHRDERLRGCIGYIEGLRPLPLALQETAIAAAFRDPRFEPLTADELDKVEIEISVLSPLRRIESLNEIELGKHGVMMRLGNHHGLLLPQVASKSDWNVETFLAYVCRKADLPSDAWKDPDAEIYIFEAEIFSDATLSDAGD
jgi:AmmeMemoRadiSam system protein A